MNLAQAPALAAPLDTVRRVATPEGCELYLCIAGPTIRVRAWLFDALIRLIIFAGIAIALGFAGLFGPGIAMLITFFLEWLYPVVFEVYANGATPGKKLCDIQVLHDDGTPIGWGASFSRNTLRFVDFLPFGYTSGLLTLWLNKDSKRIGDLLAGTVVVYRKTDTLPATNDHFLDVEAPPFPLTFPEQRALIEYRQRADKLTEARAFELAELVLPLTENLHPEAAKMRLFRIANGLLGRRADEASGQ